MVTQDYVAGYCFPKYVCKDVTPIAAACSLTVTLAEATTIAYVPLNHYC